MSSESPYQAPAATGTPATQQERPSKARFWKRAIWGSVVMIVVPPFLGLAGTMVGMTRAFGELENSGSADPAELAGDISMVLITTLYGLGFSVIGLVLLIVSIVQFRSCRIITQPTGH